MRASAVPRRIENRRPEECSERRKRSGLWSDVLVHPEQVVRIVLGLDLREPFVVGPIGAGAHAIGFVLRHEVHVHAAGAVARGVVEQPSCPGDAALVLGRISPARVHVQGPVDVTVRVRRGIDRLAVDRASQLGEGDLAFVAGEPRSGVDEDIDQTVVDAGEAVRLPVFLAPGVRSGSRAVCQPAKGTGPITSAIGVPSACTGAMALRPSSMLPT